ncbi:CGNR zinc finger domain-containing protein [Frondihabitans australicus]|uniref:Putative RNA-binding Zn ribbon-like protein n=1 Tax=Frondihabitans australicus TaxID=386892 RepID=A0A495IGK1_9MICO|nr:CGNR zinc finger domain-containing protein [Frondihabitans australicus]RKR74790.1 putative RNA-binding Zn ribbon-like protein [Frondihabitans australicus]
MTWTAIERFGAAAAPAELGLVQDFLMTAAAGTPRQPDLFDEQATAETWAEQALGPGDWSLDAGDLTALKHMRASVLGVIEARDGLPTSSTWHLPTSRLSISLNTHGEVRPEPTGPPRQRILGAVLLAVHDAQIRDTWRRLKACKNDTCRGIFYDLSNNNSRVWHNVKTCGNVENLRALRARRKVAR